MDTLIADLLGILAIALFVLSNGFFVAAEFSLVSVRRTRIAELAERGMAGAQVYKRRSKTQIG
jgi:CBS domain containing-hemolysin-like protein